METRQEVVSAGEERLRDANSSVYLGAGVGEVRAKSPLTRLPADLGAPRNLKNRHLWNAVPELLLSSLMHWFSERAEPAGAHSREWIYSGISKTSILQRTPQHRND